MISNLEYLDQNGLRNFPFLDNSQASAFPTNAVLDLQITSNVDYPEVYLYSIEKTGSGASPIWTFNFSSSTTGNPIIGSVTVQNFTSRFTYSSFIYPNLSNQNRYFCIRIVPGDGLFKVTQTQVFAGKLKVIPTLVIYNAYGVSKLTASTVIDDSGTEINPYTYNAIRDVNHLSNFHVANNINLREGTNVDLSLGTNLANFAVSPGAGAGLYNPCVETDLFIKKINNAVPDGVYNYNFGGDACFTIEMRNPVSSSEQHPNVLIHQICDPKCSPDQVIAYAHYLNRVRSLLAAVYTEVEDIRNYIQEKLAEIARKVLELRNRPPYLEISSLTNLRQPPFAALAYNIGLFNPSGVSLTASLTSPQINSPIFIVGSKLIVNEVESVGTSQIGFVDKLISSCDSPVLNTFVIKSTVTPVHHHFICNFTFAQGSAIFSGAGVCGAEIPQFLGDGISLRIFYSKFIRNGLNFITGKVKVRNIPASTPDTFITVTSAGVSTVVTRASNNVWKFVMLLPTAVPRTITFATTGSVSRTLTV